MTNSIIKTIKLNTPCTIVKATSNLNEYSRTTVLNKPAYRHRVTWEEANGPIPSGMEVNHICNCKACYNLEHLELVTHKENLAHSMRLGRQQGKLGLKEIREIRILLDSSDLTQKDIAEMYGVTQSLISRIKTGKRNAWIDERIVVIDYLGNSI